MDENVELCRVSNDYGSDLITCNAQMHRLSETGKVAESFKDNLDSQAQKVTQILSSEQAKEAMGEIKSKEKITEREVPQVQALYAYNGKDVQTQKGEIMFLIAKTNNDWWSIRRANGSVGFVPRNYIVEIAPKVILVRTVENESSLVADTIQSFNLKGRLSGLEKEHQLLLQKLQERREMLSNYQSLFKFCDECDSSLLRMKGQMDAIERNKAKDNHSSDSLKQHQTVVEALVQRANELQRIFPSEQRALVSMIEKVTKQWRDLQLLNKRTSDGRKETIEADKIQEDCQESLSWLHEKKGALEALISSRTKSNAEPMLRKFEIFQRELVPLQEKVISVKSKYEKWSHIPHLRNQVEQLNSEHLLLRERFEEQQEKLVSDIDNESFRKKHAEIHSWILARKRQLELEADTNNMDRLATLIKEIGEEHQSKTTEIEELLQMSVGNKQRQAQSADLCRELQDLGNELQELEQKIFRGEKKSRLKREHSTVKKLLETLKTHMEKSYDEHEIEEAFTAQNNLALKMTTTESRISNLRHWLQENGGQSDDDRTSDSEDSAMLEELMHQLAENKALFEGAEQKNADLKSFLDFKLSTEDALDFISLKMKSASPEGIQSNGVSLKKKLKQQGALETEIRVYASQIKMLNIIGSKMVRNNHSRAKDISGFLDKLNNNWDSLVDMISSKSDVLQQSKELISFLESHENIRNELAALEDCLEYTAPENKTDCMKKVTATQIYASRLEKVLASIQGLGEQQAILNPILQNFPGRDDIERDVSNTVSAGERLQDQLPKNLEKYAKLEEYFNFMVALDMEKQWLEEKLRLLDSLNKSQNHDHVQSRGKTLGEEIASHSPLVEKLVLDLSLIHI